jgi:hypothetical protein
MAAENPGEKPTVEGLLSGLVDSTREGFKEVNANIALVANELDVLKGRSGVIEGRLTELEGWRGRTSDRVRGIAATTSSADLEHSAVLANEILARQTLAMKVDALDAKQDVQLQILARLDSIAKNPIVKQVATALGTAVLTWLSLRGLK